MSDRTEAIGRLLADYNRHDGAAFASHFTEDGVLRFVVGGEIVEGREQVEAAMEEVWRAVPDWKLEPRGLYDSGEAVWLAWTITGTIEGEFRGMPPCPSRRPVCRCFLRFATADSRATEDACGSPLARTVPARWRRPLARRRRNP